ncbi:MAG TPA: hypothetical protein V6C58_03060 [Allocoleopsis sp.]
MELIYLDYNCFQRSFDDPLQTRIQLEAIACRGLFIKAEAKLVTLIWSFMHLDETLLCPFPDRQNAVLGLSSLCQVRLGPKTEIMDIANFYQKTANLSSKDAVHLACSVYLKADFFLTCDEQLIRRSTRLNLEIIIINPVDYIRREMN